MAIANNLLAKIDELDILLVQTTDIHEARKLLALADTVTSLASKVCSNVNKVSDCKEDKEHAHTVAVKAAAIKLKVEARLGELIRSEQEAGRLASQESGRPRNKCNASVTLTTLKDVGLSRMDSQRAQMVADKKNLIPEIVEEAKNKGDVPTRKDLEKKVKQIKQDKKRKEQITAIENLPSLPDGKFHIIVIDPPWSYEKRTDDISHRGRSPYPQMTIDEIIAKPPPCTDDCIVWLWTTNAFMHDAFHILDAWNLEPKTILTWKKNKFGVGDWLRGQTEHCILAIKGHPIVTLTNQSTIFEGDVREHSRKPESFYALVEELCHGSKCEMYGREKREGWIVSGELEFQ